MRLLKNCNPNSCNFIKDRIIVIAKFNSRVKIYNLNKININNNTQGLLKYLKDSQRIQKKIAKWLNKLYKTNKILYLLIDRELIL